MLFLLRWVRLPGMKFNHPRVQTMSGSLDNYEGGRLFLYDDDETNVLDKKFSKQTASIGIELCARYCHLGSGLFDNY
jgi:hypothetical protein